MIGLRYLQLRAQRRHQERILAMALHAMFAVVVMNRFSDLFRRRDAVADRVPEDVQ